MVSNERHHQYKKEHRCWNCGIKLKKSHKQIRCIKCGEEQIRYNNNWRKANPNYMREWYKKNKEYFKKWRKNNLDKVERYNKKKKKQRRSKK